MNHKDRLKKKGFDFFTSFMALEQDVPLYKEVYLNKAREAGYASIIICRTKKDDDGMCYSEVWTNKVKVK